MARLFDDGVPQYLAVDASPIAGHPYAIVGWMHTDDLVPTQCVFAFVDKDAGNKRYGIYFAGGADNEKIAFLADDAGVDTVFTTAGILAINVWHHVCAIGASVTDRRVLLDNGNKNTTVVFKGFNNVDRMSIGRFMDFTPSSPFSGGLAEIGIYDLSAWPGATGPLKADAFEAWALPALAAGRPPSEIPLGLVAYWPLIRTDQDWVGGYDMTAFGGPTVADHPPRIAYPRPRSMVWRAAVVPVKVYDYRRRRV